MDLRMILFAIQSHHAKYDSEGKADKKNGEVSAKKRMSLLFVAMANLQRQVRAKVNLGKVIFNESARGAETEETVQENREKAMSRTQERHAGELCRACRPRSCSQGLIEL